MRSIKPGRGTSVLSAAGGIVAVLFGVVWTQMAKSMGAPGFFVLFGILFILLALGGVLYNINNAIRKYRMSIYDITDSREEPDPLQERFGPGAGDAGKEQQRNGTEAGETDRVNSQDAVGYGNASHGKFCPYCRYEIKGDYTYCPGCGKDISRI